MTLVGLLHTRKGSRWREGIRARWTDTINHPHPPLNLPPTWDNRPRLYSLRGVINKFTKYKTTLNFAKHLNIPNNNKKIIKKHSRPGDSLKSATVTYHIVFPAPRATVIFKGWKLHMLVKTHIRHVWIYSRWIAKMWLKLIKLNRTDFAVAPICNNDQVITNYKLYYKLN